MGKNNGQVRGVGLRCGRALKFFRINRFRCNLHNVLVRWIDLFLLSTVRQDDQAERTHASPEKSAQATSKSQRQPRGGCEAEHLRNKNVSALIGSDIAWIECAG